MKNTAFIIVFYFFLGFNSNGQNDFFIQSNNFFKKYVDYGLVNYDLVKSDAKSIDNIVKLIADFNLNNKNEKVQKAFYINAYNILVIKSIASSFPVSSPVEIEGIFDIKKHNVAGTTTTLNNLENTFLRERFKDARLHFVLVCGAKSCPPLTSYSYQAEKLDSMLDAQTKKAINLNYYVQPDTSKKELLLSEIFNWYKEDFGKNNQELIDFINNYRNEIIPSNYKIKYNTYDWSTNDTERLNNQLYNAGTLLKKGQIDITVFNSIYTETNQNWRGKNYDGYRTTFATSLIQLTVGISQNSRINIGIDISPKASATIGNKSNKGIIEPFNFSNDSTHRSGIGLIGTRIRLNPIKKVPNFTLQSSYNISVAKSPEGNSDLYWIEWDRHIWWNQLFYTQMIAHDKIQFFTELDFLFRFKKYDTQVSIIDLPMNLFVSYFPSKKITLYTMGQHVPRFVPQAGNKPDWPINSNYSQLGGGIKYQFTPQLNVEFLYSNFVRGKNTGLGNTFNLGIKYIK